MDQNKIFFPNDSFYESILAFLYINGKGMSSDKLLPPPSMENVEVEISILITPVGVDGDYTAEMQFVCTCQPDSKRNQKTTLTYCLGSLDNAYLILNHHTIKNKCFEDMLLYQSDKIDEEKMVAILNDSYPLEFSQEWPDGLYNIVAAIQEIDRSDRLVHLAKINDIQVYKDFLNEQLHTRSESKLAYLLRDKLRTYNSFSLNLFNSSSNTIFPEIIYYSKSILN